MAGVQIAVAPSETFPVSDLVRYPSRLKLLIALFKIISFIATITGVCYVFPDQKINTAISINCGLNKHGILRRR